MALVVDGRGQISDQELPTGQTQRQRGADWPIESITSPKGSTGVGDIDSDDHFRNKSILTKIEIIFEAKKD